LLILVPKGSAASVIDLERGVHPDFELLVVYCDTLPEFSLYYDRVRGECRLELVDGECSGEVRRKAASFRPGVTLQSVGADPSVGTITLMVKGTVYLREYLVSGPPALLLDISEAEDAPGRLPFELGRDEYLRRGGDAERAGQLDLALRYIEWVQRSGPQEPFLEHRAGVIYHRLGRWEAALEAFARTAELPEFAADAHARRTMILLAAGDTSAACRVWTGYFHRVHPGEVYYGAGASLSKSTVPSHRLKRPSERWSVPIPSMVKAGGGTNMYLGWGLLVVGLLALIGLLVDPWRGTALTAKPYPAHRVASDDDFRHGFSTGPPLTLRGLRPSGSVGEDRSYAARAEPTRVSSRVADLYRGEAVHGGRPTSGTRLRGEGDRRIPTDLIRQKARAGAGELEIARELGVGRDEVSMVLNLARLAGGGRVGQGS